MAKIVTVIGAQVDSKGKEIEFDGRKTARDGGDSATFAPVEPATYDAVVTKLELASYRARSGGNVSPAADGLWEYHKAIPAITLLNKAGTQITRQDFTIGVMQDGKFIRPDGKPESPIWKQGQWLLSALGVFKVDENDPTNVSLVLNDELIFDRVIRVKTGLAAYIKEPRLNFDVVALDELFTDLFGSSKYEFSHVDELVKKFNNLSVEALVTLKFSEKDAKAIVAGRADAGDGLLKIKNVVQAVYGITKEHAAEKGWYYDPTCGAVFVTVASWTKFKQLELADNQHTPPNF